VLVVPILFVIFIFRAQGRFLQARSRETQRMYLGRREQEAVSYKRR
jgi:hypothetical protein